MGSNQSSSSRVDKGVLLELRVARLLLAEGMTPFVNVFFRKEFDPSSLSSPDVDVMGIRPMPDSIMTYAHYDCKSGHSEVVSRILMLLGLKNSLPAGPITYIRKRTNHDLKVYALQCGIRLGSVAQIEEREQLIVDPLFGTDFPSVSNEHVHALWITTGKTNRDNSLGRIIRYFNFEFWTETRYTRLRRTVAALTQLPQSCTQAGVHNLDQDVLIAYAMRFFLFSLIDASTYVAYFSEAEVAKSLSEWFVTEKLPVYDYQQIVESTAQLTFQIYGDQSKGPLRKDLYSVPPPEYTPELIDLIIRTVHLRDDLPWALTSFDALLFEDAILNRVAVARAMLSKASKDNVLNMKRWLRSVKLFLANVEPRMNDWRGWSAVNSVSSGTEIGS
jgi:hypothetical protein